MWRFSSHIRALRHIRGYGIHSPFAFMLATEVIRLPKGYSYYDEKEAASLMPRSFRRLGMALHRFKWRFGDCVIKFVSPDNIAEISKMIETSSQNGSIPTAMVIIKPYPETIRHIAEIASSGVLFHGKKALIYFSHPAMRFIAYDYRF